MAIVYYNSRIAKNFFIVFDETSRRVTGSGPRPSHVRRGSGNAGGEYGIFYRFKKEGYLSQCFIQVVGGTDQGQVGEGLGKVTQGFTPGADLCADYR